MQDKSNRPPFRDTIREKNGIPAAQKVLADFEAGSKSYDDNGWARAAGRFAATVEDLLAIVENLQAVADHAEGGAS